MSLVKTVAAASEERASALVHVVLELSEHVETAAEKEALERAAMLAAVVEGLLRSVRRGEAAPVAETFATVKEAA